MKPCRTLSDHNKRLRYLVNEAAKLLLGSKLANIRAATLTPREGAWLDQAYEYLEEAKP